MSSFDVYRDAFGNILDAGSSIITGAEFNDMEIVKQALLHDPHLVNSRHPRSGVTALHIAAANRNLSMVSFLVEQPGINLTSVDRFGRDALDLAINVGDRRIIDLLSRMMFPKTAALGVIDPSPK